MFVENGSCLKPLVGVNAQRLAKRKTSLSSSIFLNQLEHMYQPSAELIIDYPSFLVNYDGPKPESDTGVKFKASCLFTLPDIRPEKIRRIKTETGFGDKSSWFQKIFGNHLIKP